MAIALTSTVAHAERHMGVCTPAEKKRGCYEDDACAGGEKNPHCWIVCECGNLRSNAGKKLNLKNAVSLCSLDRSN